MHGRTLSALAALVLIAGPAAAQSAATSTAPAAQPSTTVAAPMHKQGEWRASKLIGVDVYNNGNEKIGDINDVILDSGGRVANVVIGVGGFLGMGEHNVAMSFDQLKFVNEPARTASTTATTTAPANSTTTTGSNSATARSEKNWYPDHVVVNTDKEQLKKMPAFKY